MHCNLLIILYCTVYIFSERLTTTLFNCVNNSSAKTLAFDVSYESSIRVLPEEVKDAIRNLDCNKSCGLDGV